MTALEWLGQASLIGASVLLLSSLLFSAVYPLYRKLLIKLSVHGKYTFSFVFSFSSLLCAVCTTLFFLFPDLANFVVFNHCHQDECGSHSPSAGDLSLLSLALLALYLSAALGLLFIVVTTVFAVQKKLKLLTLLSSKKDRSDTKIDYHIVESHDVFAWCAGLIKPQIYVSRGMLAQTSHKQLESVLAHEQCHKQQRDNLRKLLLHWQTIFWLPRFKQKIRKDYHQWLEAHSDWYAKAVSRNQLSSNTVDLGFFLHLALLCTLLALSVLLFTSGAHFIIELV